MNVRNSDFATVRVNYIETSRVQCLANTLFLTLEQSFSRMKSLTCVDLHLVMGVWKRKWRQGLVVQHKLSEV